MLISKNMKNCYWHKVNKVYHDAHLTQKDIVRILGICRNLGTYRWHTYRNYRIKNKHIFSYKEFC